MVDVIPVCTGELDFLSGNPVCSGAWRSESLSTLQTVFDPSSLDPAAVVNAFGAGFIVMGIPLLVILVSRLIIDSIRGKR